MQVSSYCFWPQGSGGGATSEAEDEEVYGELRVCLKKVRGHGDIMERRLEVTGTGGREEERRMVKLLQLSGWSLGEMPSPTVILSLVDLMSKAQRSSPRRTTVIMCRLHDTQPPPVPLRHKSSDSVCVCLCVTVMELVAVGHSSASTLSWRD